MFRIVNMSGKYYGLKITDIDNDIENINSFIEGGEPVILCETLDDLDIFNIDKNNVQIVEND